MAMESEETRNTDESRFTLFTGACRTREYFGLWSLGRYNQLGRVERVPYRYIRKQCGTTNRQTNERGISAQSLSEYGSGEITEMLLT